MPLSDRERQILSEIEARLESDDPKFARTVATLPKAAGRIKLRYGIVGFLIGMIMLLGIAVHPVWGFGGFALMLISAVTVLNQLKHFGTDNSRDLGGQLRGGLSRYMEGRRREDDSG